MDNISSSTASASSTGPTPVVVDQRKRKRMLSNRESARRSRQRKQRHLEELTAQAMQLRKENAQMMAVLSATAQVYVAVESENAVLRTQAMELSARLESLNEIMCYMNGGDMVADHMFQYC